MNRHAVTMISVLAVASGPSALFTTNALGSPVSPDARDANSAALAEQYVDLRSPDARDSGRVVSQPQSAVRTDLRSPDARDAARFAVSQTPSHSVVDGRSPDTRDTDARDARDAARFAVSQTPSYSVVDGRSPDTRDVANGVRFVTLPPTEVVNAPSSGGFEWGDAGIGAGGALLIALLALGTAVGIQHHRRMPSTRTPLAG